MYDRFDYASFRSLDRAENALEHYYACGEVDDTDLPRIERRNTSTRGVDRYVITLAGIGR